MSRLLDKLTASVVSGMYLKPAFFNRPSKKTVVSKTLKEMGFSADDYLTWETEHFTVSSGDVEIPAEYHPVPNHKGIAIMAHGYGQNRYVMIPHAEILRKEGYSIIMFDQRHFGVSKAPYCSFGYHEADDLIELIKWAKKKSGEDTRIVVLGVSMGAMTLMTALGRSDLIDAAIEDCGPARMSEVCDKFYQVLFKKTNPFLFEAFRKKAAKYGMDASGHLPIEGVRKSEKPLLVIISDRDSLISVDTSKEILSASRNPLSKIRIFPDVEHGLSITFFDEYSAEVHAFLKSVFGD